MLAPDIRSRMKQANQLASFGVDAGNVRTFVAIAVETGEGEILADGGSSVLARNDVIDPKGQPVLRMRNAAILTAVPGPVPDLLNQGRSQEEGEEPDFSRRRAFDCKMERRLPT